MSEDTEEIFELYGRITGIRMGHIRERHRLVSDLEIFDENGGIIGHLSVPYEKEDKIGSTYKLSIEAVEIPADSFYEIIRGKVKKKKELQYIG